MIEYVFLAVMAMALSGLASLLFIALSPIWIMLWAIKGLTELLRHKPIEPKDRASEFRKEREA